MDKKLRLIIIFVGIVIILFVLVLTKVVSDNSRCLNNPFVTGVRELEKQGAKDVICSCDLEDSSTLYFDRDGIYDQHPLNIVLKGGVLNG